MTKVDHPVTDVGWRQWAEDLRSIRKTLPLVTNWSFWARRIAEAAPEYTWAKCLDIARLMANL